MPLGIRRPGTYRFKDEAARSATGVSLSEEALGYRLYADSLLSGRSYILIPREYYTGPSLSPDPVQSVEESALKRFQVRTKCVEYDIAKVYLEESGWDFDRAVERWEADEAWERVNGSSSSGARVRAGKATGKPNMSVGMRKGFFR